MVDFLNRVWTHISSQSPTVIIITTLLLFLIFILWYETLNERLDWRDLITSAATNRVSLTRVLQLVGGVVGTWIMVIVTLDDKLTAELFFTYLAYVGAIEGWSKFITAKYGTSNDVSRPYGRPQIGRYGYGDYPNQYPNQYPQQPPTEPISAKPPTGDDI